MKGTLVIVPCGGQKIWSKHLDLGAVPAREAYTSGFFKVNRAYAEKFGDAWIILSAKYGFISPDFPIPGPYNVTFSRKSTVPVSVTTLRQQIKDHELDKARSVIGLGGKDYRKVVQAAFAGSPCTAIFPFSNLPGMGYIMQAVKQATETGQAFRE